MTAPTGLQAFGLSFADKLQARQRRSQGLGPMGFGRFCREILKLEHSPVMAGIVAASEGAPVLLPDDVCMDVFGCTADKLPTSPKKVVAVRAGGRAGKSSRLLAPKAIHAAWTVPLPTLRRGEFARALLTAPQDTDSETVLDYCRGYIHDSPLLKAHLIDAPDEEDEEDEIAIGTKKRIALRRPDGTLVEIAIRAASAKGRTGRGKTLVFAGVDEAEFFNIGESGSGQRYAVSDAEIIRAVLPRIVDGGQAWLVSTPWVEHAGELEQTIDANYGHHTTALVAVAGTRLLNPTWDPNGAIEAYERERDPENAAREIDAIPLTSGTKQFFPEDAIQTSFRASRTVELQPVVGMAHWAGVDFGFRKNSSAIAISRGEAGMARIAHEHELRPQRGASLKPSAVVKDFAYRCMRYGVRSMRGDLHYADTAHEELAKLAAAMRSPEKADEETREWVEMVKRDPFAARNPVPSYDEWHVTDANKADLFTEFRRRMQESRMDLLFSERLRDQLRQTTYRAGTGGVVKVILPKIGASHGDLLGAVALAGSMATIQVAAPRRQREADGGGMGDYGGNRQTERRYSGDERGFG